VKRSSLTELIVGAARFMTRFNVAVRYPVRDDQLATGYVPLDSDETSNRNEFCYRVGADATWLSRKELDAWNKGREPRRLQQIKVLDGVRDAFNAIRLKVGADRGKIKAVQKLPGGGVKLLVKNLYGGTQCEHTGRWMWNGQFWSDCTYRSTPEKEIYPFTVTLTSERIPPQGLRVGDVISAWGLRTPGRNDRAPLENASYEGLVIAGLDRGTKRLIDLRLEDYLDECGPYR
jgi:hypothetical protein